MSGFPLRHVRFLLPAQSTIVPALSNVDMKGFSGGVREHIFNLDISKLLKSASMLVLYKKRGIQANYF